MKPIEIYEALKKIYEFLWKPNRILMEMLEAHNELY